MLDWLVSTVGSGPAALLIALVGLLMFYLLSEVCEDALTPALETVSEKFGLPHDVACATFVALGSSAAEIGVNSVASFHGTHRELNLATGALVGSALIAFSLIPAICTFVSPDRRMKLQGIPLARDCGFFCVSLYLIIRFSADENFDLTESAIMCGTFVAYFVVMYALISTYHEMALDAEQIPQEASFDVPSGIAKSRDSYGAVIGDFENPEISVLPQQSKKLSLLKRIKRLVPPFGHSDKDIRHSAVWFTFVSICFISGLSEICLILATSFASVLQISQHFTGFILVAMATQIDDFTTTMATARRGKGSGSLSNAIGSQVINLTIGFGLPFLISNFARNYAVPVVRQESSAYLVYASVAVFVLCVAAGRMTLRWYSSFIMVGAYCLVVRQFLTDPSFQMGDDGDRR